MQPFQPFPPLSAPINPTLIPQRIVTVMPNPGLTYAAGPPQIFARTMMPRRVVVAPAMVHKPITLYVGQLSAKVKDEFFEKLLAYCGPLKSWKRITKSFGFVEFQNSDGALRATRLLNGWPLFGKKLLINADKESTKELDQYVLHVKIGKIRPTTQPGDDGRGKSGEQIMAEQDAVATSLITELIAAEAEKQNLNVNEKKESTTKTVSPSKSRSRSREKPNLPPASSRGSGVESSSRRLSSRSSKRDRRKRSRSRSGRSDSRYRSRDSRKHRKKERRHRSETPERKRSKEYKKRRESAPEGPPKPKRKKKEMPKTAKELVAYIPKDNSDLLKYPIDWDLVKKHDLVEKIMRGWIDARITEYLGEKEDDLTNFAVGLLAHSVAPKGIIAEMKMVLVEDAQGFVVKMWRRLIFECLKAKYNIS